MSNQAGTKRYLYYPEPKKGPDVPYNAQRKKNPALIGIQLIISALLLEWLGFLRKIIWKNAGFGDLRLIVNHLEQYDPRYDPAVVPLDQPIASNDDTSDEANQSASSSPAKSTPSKYYSVADYHAMYLSGELTPLAVAKAILPLIRHDITPPGEHSIAWFESNVDMILAAAEASTLRYKEKRPLGPLDGVPTAVKDDYDVDGYKTNLGSLNDYTTPPTPERSTTNWCVRQMEKEGMVILGKLAMHEFGLDTSGNNPNHGFPRNPYNSNYYTGGSSSGPSYAVSAGLIPVVLGSDGGGSIRIPAAFCSAVGLKPTHGRLSHFPGLNHSSTCSVNGPIAADIRSLEALYRVAGAPDSTSPFAPVSPLVFSPSLPRNKILGIPEAWVAQSTKPMQRLFQSMVDQLVKSHGYTVVPIEIPYLVEGQTAHAMTVLTDASTVLRETSNLNAGNRILLALGRTTPSTDYLLAQKLRHLLMQHMAYLWKTHPGMIILTPVTSCPGWPIRSQTELKYGISDGDQTKQTMEYVWMANFLGMPSITVPMGYVVPEGQKDQGEIASQDVEGKVPVGMMAMGEWAAEEDLLQWGLQAEQVGAEIRSRPPIWVDVVERARELMKLGDDSTDEDD